MEVLREGKVSDTINVYYKMKSRGLRIKPWGTKESDTKIIRNGIKGNDRTKII